MKKQRFELTDPIIDQWYQDWIKKDSTKTALNLFNNEVEAFGDSEMEDYYNRWFGYEIEVKYHRASSALARIVIACFKAAHYDEKSDRNKIYRDKIRADQKKLATLARAAKVLKNATAKSNSGMTWALTHASLNSGMYLADRNNESLDINLSHEKYFTELEEALRNKKLVFTTPFSPYIPELSKGNITYLNKKPITKGKTVDAESMLAFEITFYLRWLTANQIRFLINSTMPEYGNPHYNVVAAFCHAVFIDTSWDAKQIGDKVRDLVNNKAALTEWQGVNYSKNKII
jgi:hypothetical protein